MNVVTKITKCAFPVSKIPKQVPTYFQGSLLFVALAITGCGGDSNSENESFTPAPSTTTQLLPEAYSNGYTPVSSFATYFTFDGSGAVDYTSETIYSTITEDGSFIATTVYTEYDGSQSNASRRVYDLNEAGLFETRAFFRQKDGNEFSKDPEINDRSYEYNSDGYLMSQSWNGGDQSYRYDTFNRLVERTYTSDDFKRNSTVVWSGNNVARRMDQVEWVCSDGLGNERRWSFSEVYTYQYNARGNVTTITKVDDGTEQVEVGENHLCSEQEMGSYTEYFWDEADNLTQVDHWIQGGFDLRSQIIFQYMTSEKNQLNPILFWYTNSPHSW